jgi:hypothetical protein
MNEFLASLKADLLDRRMLPILVVLGVALAGALAYAALGGGGASTPTPVASSVAPPSASAPASSISASASTAGAVQPVAETTSGSVHRSAGAARNPFAPLPGAKAAAAAESAATSAPSTTTSPASTTGAGSGAGAGSESSTPTTGGSEPTKTESKPEVKAAPKKAKKQTVYRVAVLFGAVPAGSPVPAANLTPYENLTRQQPLPSVAQPLVVFRGVIAGAKSATFTLVGEAILRGSAVCRPSTAQCQAIDLQLGETEELEYVPPEGAPVVYQLKLVSITASKASALAARRAYASQFKGGMQVLRTVGLQALPGLHYSSVDGVLVRAKHLTLAARAHALPWVGALRD